MNLIQVPVRLSIRSNLSNHGFFIGDAPPPPLTTTTAAAAAAAGEVKFIINGESRGTQLLPDQPVGEFSSFAVVIVVAVVMVTVLVIAVVIVVFVCRVESFLEDLEFCS